VVAHRDLDDPPRDFGADRDDVRLDVRVLGLDVASALGVVVQRDRCHGERHAEKQQYSQNDAHHRPLLCSRSRFDLIASRLSTKRSRSAAESPRVRRGAGPRQVERIVRSAGSTSFVSLTRQMRRSRASCVRRTQPFVSRPIEQAAERRLLDLEQFSELGLRDAVGAEQMRESPHPLGARQAELADAPVVHRAQQPRDVVQQEAEVARQVLTEHRAILVAWLTMSKASKDAATTHAGGVHCQ
jgi:hypothetical protein